jgi:hypothetical protein
MAAVGVVFMWHWLQGSGGEAVATILRRECTNAVHAGFLGGERQLNIVLVLIVLLLLFGGGGFYYGGPYVGGGLGTILLIVLIVVLFRGA